MDKRITDLTGKIFGRLTVIEITDQRQDRKVVWKCRCECNKEMFANGDNLRAGRIKSCGCYHKERAAEVAIKNFTTHGMSYIPEYDIWNGMIQRCTNEKHQAYPDYGERGIMVCQRWLSFENFIADMGYRPGPEYTIERRDNNGPYEKNNCYWATREEQANNKRNNVYYEYKGERLTIAQLARKYNINYHTLHYQLVEKKLSTEEAIEKLTH